MASPARAAKRRNERENRKLAEQDPAFVQQQQAAQQQQGVATLVQQYETAMAALSRANRDLGIYEGEVVRLRQLGQQLEEENAGLLADLEASDKDISDCVGVLRCVKGAMKDEADVLIARLAPEDKATALEAVPEPAAETNGHGEVVDIAELAPIE